MIEIIKSNAGWVALVILAIMGYSYLTTTPKLAGVDPSKYTSFTSLNVVTSDTATSTSAFGCIQTVATSTETPIILQFAKSNTASTTFSGTSYGTVVWQFGSCPE